jgi:hypothetical protein
MSDNIARRPHSPWVPYYVPDKAFNGYTLFTPMMGSVTWLIDMEGRPVHAWAMPYPPGGYGRLLPNGNMVYAGKDISGAAAWGGASGGILLEVDWDGNVLWELKTPLQHHDFWRLDNGNSMFLGLVEVPADIAAKVKGGNPGTERDGVMWTDFFREVTPTGETVWEWYAYEHLDLDIDVIAPMTGRAEWTHANSCFVMPNGDILTTLHHLNTIDIIDRSTGDIKWRWGVNELAHPHDPTLLDNGNILVFDNGTYRPRPPSYSRVVEVNPKTNEIVWEYKVDPPHTFYSHFISGAQRLPNGNTLICEGAWGRFFEVTMDKEIVWEYIHPFHSLRTDGWTSQVFRAFRYAPDDKALQGRNLDPDRVELMLREKPQGEEQAVQERLGRLGY